MRKNRKIRKEDIGDPSNFVHVKHVGFGQKKSSMVSLHNQRSLDLGGESERETESESNSPAIVVDQAGFPLVERRSRGSRSSLVPRHHRSTTTCIFPDNGHPLQNHLSIPSPRNSRGGERHSPDKSGGSLKPTFGSLLNLNFLPLGLGKSSSKSSSVGKTKRMSLLNLTASHLFAVQKVPGEEKRDSVMMTGYTRRRSLSNSSDKDDDAERNGTLKKQSKEKHEKKIPVEPPSLPAREKNTASPIPPSTPTSKIPLAKLGRSKSTMSEFTKRPKLRLKIVPPVAPPPPIPIIARAKLGVEAQQADDLPPPPPSPLPSPPKTPTSAPPIPPPPLSLEDEELAVQVVLRKAPSSPPRSRIIQLPPSPSVDSPDPASPQYLTPVGGSSPMPVPVGESSFPILSPTTPPISTPFFSASQRFPGTPPVWPLQPVWPTHLSRAMQQTEPTILEIPSPTKEEMDVVESEYDPVASIVDSFISEGHVQGNLENPSGSTSQEYNKAGRNNTACPNNLKLIRSTLRDNIPNAELPNVIAKLFNSTLALSADTPKSSDKASRINAIHNKILTKTLELWVELSDGHVSIDNIAKIVEEENPQAADSLRKICLPENNR